MGFIKTAGVSNPYELGGHYCHHHPIVGSHQYFKKLGLDLILWNGIGLILVKTSGSKIGEKNPNYNQSECTDIHTKDVKLQLTQSQTVLGCPFENRTLSLAVYTL